MRERRQNDSTDEILTSLHVSLVVRDFAGAPSEITARLGITPSRAAAKGETRISTTGRATSRLHEHSFWSIQSELRSTATLEEHVRSILDVVEGAAAAMREIEPPTTREIYCTIIPGGPVPLLTLESETMRRVSDLGCDLVIDVLYLDLE